MVEVTIRDALLIDVQRAVEQYQPELTISTANGVIILEGLFVVSGPLGPFDSYQIWTGIPASFPEDEPVVFETGRRIPRIVDRHVFPKHGNCCIGIWEEWLLTTPDHRFETFLNGIMHDYFVSQTYYEAKGEWPFGERSHGALGVLESYADLLGLAPGAKIVADYLDLLSRQKIKGHAWCPCGSGKRLRQCHSDELRELSSRISPAMAKRMHQTIAPKKSTWNIGRARRSRGSSRSAVARSRS